jgi:hypothetical protein
LVLMEVTGPWVSVMAATDDGSAWTSAAVGKSCGLI